MKETATLLEVPINFVEAVLKEFHEIGLWVAQLQANGKYKIVRQRLSDAEFSEASRKLSGMDEFGLGAAHAEQRQKVLDDRWSEQAKRKMGEIEWNVRHLYGVP